MQFNKNEQVFRVQPDRDFLNEFLVSDVRCHFTACTHIAHRFNGSASISFLVVVCLLVLLSSHSYSECVRNRSITNQNENRISLFSL